MSSLAASSPRNVRSSARIVACKSVAEDFPYQARSPSNRSKVSPLAFHASTNPSAFLRQGYGWAALFLGILSVANFSAWPTSYEAIRWFHRLPLVNALSPARPILLWIELALPFGLYLGRCPQTLEQTRCLRPLLSARRQESFRYRTQSILRFNGLIPTYSPPWFLGTTSWACLV